MTTDIVIVAAARTAVGKFGGSLAGAIDAPRFRYDKTWGAPATTLKLEARFDDAIVSKLKAVGHDVELSPLAYADSFGHCGGLLRHRDGRIEAAHDPRSDGGAEGI